MFCDSALLTNEAQVEALMVEKLLPFLNYGATHIKRKEAIEDFRIGRGSRKPINFKPDYIISNKEKPFFILDAKSPNVSIEDYIWQCSSYCLELNRVLTEKTVRYFVLTSGFQTVIYDWLEAQPLLRLDFDDWKEGNVKVEKLRKFLDRIEFEKNVKEQQSIKSANFKFDTIPLKELISVFQQLHRQIWSAEKKSPSAAFQELIKIMFVKFQQDRILHEKSGDILCPKPSDVIFSTAWIDSQTQSESPINDLLFRNLVKDLNREILQKKRKRFFNEEDEIDLNPNVIRKAVEKLEHIDMFGMDEDIPGRMFEAFLDATVRGKSLGQYFTPRDICRLMVHLADIHVNKNRVDTVLDACCGSGGFLILAMMDMLDKVNKLSGLTKPEKDNLREKIRSDCLYGIDAGSDPAMYRISRMNMFLHGDGGSKVYFADSLDKNIGDVGKISDERDEQLREIRNTILVDNKKFDIILSNPPFSMTYNRNHKEEAKILDKYVLGKDKSGRLRKSLPSNVMFLERYKDLISDKGTIFAIVDESILSGAKYKFVRDYIRDSFIIIGIISLPGDAFKRAASRVKTSVLILRLKQKEEEQPDIFMAMSVFLGMDEKVAKRIGISRDELNYGKTNELIGIERDFLSFCDGISGHYSVQPNQLIDRLDVKYCLDDKEETFVYWTEKGLITTELSNLVVKAIKRAERVLEEEIYHLLKVTYAGDVLDADVKNGSELSYSKLYKVKTWDILLSNMGVGRGAIGIVPPFHNGKYVSNEYTILKAKSKEEAIYYQTVLRTKGILASILAYGTGMNRGRIKWSELSNIKVPQYDSLKYNVTNDVTYLEKFWESCDTFNQSRDRQAENLADTLKLGDKESRLRWLANKPPE